MEIDDVAGAWARVEAALSRALPASLPLLAPPAAEDAIGAVEAALDLELPQEFRRSLRVHDGTTLDSGPSPVPLDQLFGTEGIVEHTLMWRENFGPEDTGDETSRVSGPVRPTLDPANRIFVGTMNSDVFWFLDLDPAPGGIPGQVVRVDPECAEFDVLAPSWTRLLHRYADDLDSGAVEIIEDLGPACEWGSAG